jgi:hypothetical protein
LEKDSELPVEERQINSTVVLEPTLTKKEIHTMLTLLLTQPSSWSRNYINVKKLIEHGVDVNRPAIIQSVGRPDKEIFPLEYAAIFCEELEDMFIFILSGLQREKNNIKVLLEKITREQGLSDDETALLKRYQEVSRLIVEKLPKNAQRKILEYFGGRKTKKRRTKCTPKIKNNKSCRKVHFAPSPP